MHPGLHAEERPDAAAYVMGTSGEVVTYGRLEERSNRLAQLWRAEGLGPGATVAVFMENNARYLEVCWAAQRAGLYYVPVNSHLTPEELAYVLEDSGAQALVTSAALADVVAGLDAPPALRIRLMVGGASAGCDSYEDAVAGQPATPIADEMEGDAMLYSSGTTGRPKGVRRPLSLAPLGEGPDPVFHALAGYGFTRESVYLSPAPLYHSAPLRFSMAVLRLGAMVVVMERFDPAECLALIERHRVTEAQFVPTMFVRMLKLPDDDRRRHDLSSLRFVLHAAAPCPVPVKEQMIDWWGPILYEYYAGTEGIGGSAITSEEWLARKGSVGRPFAPAHVVGEDGKELPAGEPGVVYFEAPVTFEYHNDPAKTAAIRNEQGWATLGDIGYLDEDGYLYLTDRRDHMVVSGGVNIYPQEVENVLTMHPAVLDVAVIGVPNDDLGEEVKAVVQPADPSAAGPALADDLVAYCRSRLAAYKCPRSVDFVDELPRQQTGKLYKRLLRDRYWEGRASRIV